MGLITWSKRSPAGGNGNPLQVFLPRRSHGQRSLVGYSWGVSRGAGHDLETKKQQQRTYPTEKAGYSTTLCKIHVIIPLVMGLFFTVRFYNITDTTLGSGKRQTWNSLLSSQDLELVLSSDPSSTAYNCVTLGKSFNLSKLQFLFFNVGIYW